MIPTASPVYRKGEKTMAKGFQDNSNIFAQAGTGMDTLAINEIAGVEFEDAQQGGIDLSSQFKEMQNAMKGDTEAAFAINLDQFAVVNADALEVITPAKRKLQAVHALMQENKYEEAIRELEQFLGSMEPDNIDALFLYAVCLQKTNQKLRSYEAMAKLQGMQIPSGMADSLRRLRETLRGAVVREKLTSLLTLSLLKNAGPLSSKVVNKDAAAYLTLDPKYEMYYTLFSMISIHLNDADEAQRIVRTGEKELGRDHPVIQNARKLLEQSYAKIKAAQVRQYYWEGKYLCAYQQAFELSRQTADNAAYKQWMLYLSQIVSAIPSGKAGDYDALAQLDKANQAVYARKEPQARVSGDTKTQNQFYAQLLSPQHGAAISQCKKSGSFLPQKALLETLSAKHPGFKLLQFFLGHALFEEFIKAPKNDAAAFAALRGKLDVIEKCFAGSADSVDSKLLETLMIMTLHNMRTIDAILIKERFNRALSNDGSSGSGSDRLARIKTELEAIGAEAERTSSLVARRYPNYQTILKNNPAKEYDAISELLNNLREACKKHLSSLGKANDVVRIQNIYLEARQAMETLAMEIKQKTATRDDIFITKDKLQEALRAIQSRERELTGGGGLFKSKDTLDSETKKQIQMLKQNLEQMLKQFP